MSRGSPNIRLSLHHHLTLNQNEMVVESPGVDAKSYRLFFIKGQPIDIFFSVDCR